MKVPKVSLCVVDYTVSVSVGRWGFTVGPIFATIDRDGDVYKMLCVKDLELTSNLFFEYPEGDLFAPKDSNVEPVPEYSNAPNPLE